jgi:hypothetical protein
MEKYKSAEWILDLLVSRELDKVIHWEYCIKVHEKTEPNDELGLAHMKGIYSAHMSMWNKLKFELTLIRMDKC